MPGPRPILAPNPAAEVIVAKEQRISADDHFAEPLDLYEKNLPARFRDRAMRFPNLALFETNHHLRAGGWDPHEKLKDLALDGISAAVIYHQLIADAWAMEDHELADAHIRVFNDWVIDFCSVNPERLWGLGMLSIWDVDVAVKELER